MNTSIRSVRLQLLSKLFWTFIIAVYFTYYIAIQLYLYKRLHTPMNYSFLILIFRTPCIIMFLVTGMTCFYLYNLGSRFCALNKFWKCLRIGSSTMQKEWTISEMIIFVECIQLLHVELSDLLRVFSLGYGLVLLFFFFFNILDICLDLFFFAIFKHCNFEIGLMPVFFFLQNITYTIVILVIATWVTEKVLICVWIIIFFFNI